ncbi:MAG: M36 family metallopeptidase, partial [Nocardioides sp.]
LFYLNNLIHDVLAKAGFTEGAGNFQETNYSGAGGGGDPVQAEAQDGGGTDNANFATPPDGQDPRMQMYLWSPPTSHQVVVGNKSYDATGAEWGAELGETGRTGPLAVANDGTGTTSDACEPLAPVTAGSIVIADRGSCNFTDKALNAQNAGAVGIIVANNSPGAPIVMGGSNRKVTIPGVMVSQRDGGTIKRSAGKPVTIRANADALLKDASLDSDVVWHEYGHGLTWRMIGRMDDALAGAIGEGMSDVLSVIVNDDPIVGEYSISDPAGIRSHSYEGYPGTYADITGTEVHADGELYGAIGWDLWKQYKAAGLGRDDILSDLVHGMPLTPSSPTYEDMRDGIIKGLEMGPNTARVCWVWSSFAKYGVGEGATGTVRGKSVLVSESFAKPGSCG